MKVQIVQSFHRFRTNPESTAEKPLREIKDSFPAGLTVDASDEDAADWVAKGYAKPAE